MGITVEDCICCGSSDLESSPAVWMPFVSHRAMELAPIAIDRSLGLKTLPDGTAYCLCKSLLCHECGHLFADYRFSEKEMERLYNDYRGREYTELREMYEPGYTARNSKISAGIYYMPFVEGFLSPFIPTSSIAVLDWGGDTGINTPFRERRSLLHIFDPSGRKSGRNDVVSFSAVPVKKTDYDLIVLSNVLEHIPFPSQTLDSVVPFMSAQTLLYVEVPLEQIQQGIESPPYSGSHRKTYWHEHINFFTESSLGKLLEGAGLTIKARKTLDLSASHETALGSTAVILQYACALEGIESNTALP